jgi:hypothetical protein
MPESAGATLLAGSVRRPAALATFFGIGIGAAAIEFAMALWSFVPGVPNAPAFALFLAIVTVVALAACTRNLRAAFLAMGLAVSVLGLLVGFQVLRMAYFAFASGST